MYICGKNTQDNSVFILEASDLIETHYEEDLLPSGL